MEGSNPNTTKFQKSRNTELTVILSLLFVALVAAGYLFLSNHTSYDQKANDNSAIDKSIEETAGKVAVDPAEVKEAFSSLDSLNEQIGESIRNLNEEISSDVSVESETDSQEDNSYASELDCWIITGLFGEKANADKMILKLENAGYEVETIIRNNGALAVGIPAISEDKELLEEIRNSIAKDAYILRK